MLQSSILHKTKINTIGIYINDELVSKSDVLVKIPIYGKAESLNAAISSAILMYEIKKYLV